jgi:hypothetical protein
MDKALIIGASYFSNIGNFGALLMITEPIVDCPSPPFPLSIISYPFLLPSQQIDFSIGNITTEYV